MRSRHLVARGAQLMTDMSMVLAGGTYWEVEDGGCRFRMSEETYLKTYGHSDPQTISSSGISIPSDALYIMRPIFFDPDNRQFVSGICRYS